SRVTPLGSGVETTGASVGAGVTVGRGRLIDGASVGAGADATATLELGPAATASTPTRASRHRPAEMTVTRRRRARSGMSAHLAPDGEDDEPDDREGGEEQGDGPLALR